jgi:hypothetical protein
MTTPDPAPATPSPAVAATPETPARPGRPRRRWSPAVARVGARVLRSAHVLTAVLLGVVSLLIAFSAYQASQWSDFANDRQALANRMSTDAVDASQDALAEQLTDTQVWVQIVASGETLDTSPLASLLSPTWVDAVRRAEAQGLGDTVLPTDARYLQEMNARSEAYATQIRTVYGEASEAGSISSRLTGASVIYSAALLLLTVASTTERRGAKLALNVVAAVIIVVALVIGLAPLR